MRYILLPLLLCACESSVTQPFKIPSYPRYLKTADAFVGMTEIEDRQILSEFLKVDPVQYEWCAAFVNASLHVNDVPGSESVNDFPLMARSFLFWGESVEEPKLGDIVIFPRGNEGWQGHVGFYINTTVVDGESFYVILGGNQDDSVSYALYPASKAIDIRRLDSPDMPYIRQKSTVDL